MTERCAAQRAAARPCTPVGADYISARAWCVIYRAAVVAGDWQGAYTMRPYRLLLHGLSDEGEGEGDENKGLNEGVEYIKIESHHAGYRHGVVAHGEIE